MSDRDAKYSLTFPVSDPNSGAVDLNMSYPRVLYSVFSSSISFSLSISPRGHRTCIQLFCDLLSCALLSRDHYPLLSSHPHFPMSSHPHISPLLPCITFSVLSRSVLFSSTIAYMSKCLILPHSTPLRPPLPSPTRVLPCKPVVFFRLRLRFLQKLLTPTDSNCDSSAPTPPVVKFVSGCHCRRNWGGAS